MANNFADLFEHSVDAMTDRVALIAAGRQVTYGELEIDANRLAHHLLDSGLGIGSHIGIHMHNSIETMVALIAAFKIRGVPININYRYSCDELAYVYDNADLAAVIHHRSYSDRVDEVLARLPRITHSVVVEDDLFTYLPSRSVPYAEAVENASDARDFGPRYADDLFIMYTGGTTGQPKGVMWRQEDMWRVLGGGTDFYTGEMVADEFQQSLMGSKNEPTRWFALPPLIHASAMMPTFTALWSGNTVVFESKFDPYRTWELVQRHQTQVLIITGDAMGRPLVDALRDRPVDVSCLSVIASGAALFAASTKDALFGLLPDVIVSDSVGSSETGFGGIGLAHRGLRQAGGPTVQPGRDSLVVDDDGRAVAPGVEGWLAKTGSVPLGYYKDPAKSAKLFRDVDGRRIVVTEDRAVQVDSGITLLGRGNMVINTGGEKVFVEEVEGVLKAFGDVYDAIVVGVPDERWGFRVAAVLATAPGATLDTYGLIEHARKALAGYKIPRSLWLEAEISRTPSGKPDYRWAQQITTTREPDHEIGLGGGEGKSR
ncbi:acyl-CoA synthetase [Aldersonia kunmingensis]|uniref:acyl-CoA synthetase n=1 Tax=Aldersonia kunmingensis TaxID=408066 RepID=UPI00082E2CB4|nr:acyl-CoA synthetase [Aldersonia kunmingensis]